MRIRSNPHTHTCWSDGQPTIEQVVLRAIELGFRAIGFSDHSVQDFHTFYTIPAEREAEYRAEVRAVGEKYRGAIRVHAGVELDAFAGKADRSQYDYILLSGHYVERDGKYALVDSHRHMDELLSIIESEFRGEGAAMAARYYEMLGEAAERVRPDIVGHFDLVKVFNRDGSLYNANAPEILRAQADALEKIAKSGAMLEINTGGLARGRIDEPYPSASLWGAWRELGGRVILGSDSHHPDTLDFAFDDMCALLLGYGFESAWELGGAGEALFVERPLRQTPQFCNRK